LREAESIQRGDSISEAGKKNIKYGTRALLLPASADAFTSIDDFEVGET
jgi:hypothetical protein